MKKLMLLIAFISLVRFVNAQKQGNIWYFGYQAGLDFSSGTPVNLSGGETGTDFNPNVINQEGTSCISDSSGNILLYTGGQTIWNRNNIAMPNGTGIKGGVSSTQSSLILPLPGSNRIFYVFTSAEFQDYAWANSSRSYDYSVVDMCLDDGKGDVIEGQKNIVLLDSSTEKLAACIDANDSGYWVVGHKMFSNQFNAWHLTSGGITDTVVSHIGTIQGWNNVHSGWDYSAAQGQMKLNASGTKLALAISNFQPAYLDLFDFNNNTGVVSNFCHMVIDSALQRDIYGIEFSPDGTKLYATLLAGPPGPPIYQFDLTAGGGNCDSIFASRLKLIQLYSCNGIGMQLAPNGKIYIVINTMHSLGCINYPNLKGFAANFDSTAVSLSASDGGYMLPSFIAGYKYYNGIPHCPTDGIEESKANNTISIFPNPVKDNISIETSQSAVIKITNIQGQLIISVNTTGNNTNIDVSVLPSGLYFIRATTEKEVVVKEFIKE